MNNEDLYSQLVNYFSNHPDLMRHLKQNACWEYIITEKTTYDEEILLSFYLYKEDEKSIIVVNQKPDIIPDLILYFTKKAILSLIDTNPNSKEYFSQYKKIMKNPKPEMEVDNKINKPRLKLLKLGYKKWQDAFKF